MIQINYTDSGAIYLNDIGASAIYLDEVLIWQASGGQPPPTPTGLTVVLEEINGQPPPTPSGLTVVLENINPGGSAPRSMSLGGNNLTLFGNNLTI